LSRDPCLYFVRKGKRTSPLSFFDPRRAATLQRRISKRTFSATRWRMGVGGPHRDEERWEPRPARSPDAPCLRSAARPHRELKMRQSAGAGSQPYAVSVLPKVPRYCRRAAIPGISIWRGSPRDRGLRAPTGGFQVGQWGALISRNFNWIRSLTQTPLPAIAPGAVWLADNFLSRPRAPRDRRSDPATIMTDCRVIPKLSI
jgi:hypothetical protein